MEVQLTAQKMFEKLGYKLIKPSKNEEHLIIYEKYQSQFDETSRITFNTSGRVISKELNDEGWCIFINELQAINKQVEELGWNNVKD